MMYFNQAKNIPVKIHIPNFRAEGVTSISPPTGLNAANWAATSVSKASGLCRPAGFPVGLSILWSGSCSSNTAISYKQSNNTNYFEWHARHTALRPADGDRSLILKKMASENL